MIAAILQFGTAGASPLAFTMDVAQLVVLGGLIWRLSEMNSAVKNLSAVTSELTKTGKEVALFMSDILTRVSVLEDRETSRRDRRKDD